MRSYKTDVIHLTNVPLANLPPITYLSDTPSVLTLENKTFTKNTTLYAWEKATIGDNINTNGFELTVISPDVDITSQSLLPNVTVIAGSPTGCSGGVSPVSEEVLNDFCQSGYNPVLVRARTNDNDRDIPITAKMEEEVNFQIFPNPFSDYIHLMYTLPNDENVTIVIQNTIGQKVKEILTDEFRIAGKHVIQHNGSDLASGIYLVTIQSKTFRKTIKLIKK